MQRILVVDDDASIRLLLEVALEDEYEIVTCADAESAEQELATTIPDAMVLDWMLPGKSGVDLLREMRTNPAYQAIPVVMLTAKSRGADEAEAMTAGADAYLTKPFNPELLAVNLEILLASPAPS